MSPIAPGMRPPFFRAWTRAALLTGILFTVGLSGADTPAEVPAADTPAAQQAEAPAVPQMATPVRQSIAEAVEALSDLDEPTRQNGMERLRTADESDIPALEKYARSNDPEVHRQIALVLKKLKRGELAFVVQYPDGTPIAGADMSIRVFMADEVTVNENPWQQMVQVMYKPPRQGFAQEFLQKDVTSDKEGRITVGRMNDAKYLVLIEAPSTLPRQFAKKTVDLHEDTAADKVSFRRGVTLTATVVDEEGKPVAGATVANVEIANMVNSLRNTPASQAGNFLRMMTSVQSDDKGVAVLEKIGLQAVQPVVICDGYEVLVADKMEVADGAKAETQLKITKIKPVEFSFTLRDGQANKPVPNARILLAVNTKMAGVFGQMWFAKLALANAEEYVKNGAIDLGTTDDKGAIKGTLVPEGYMLVALTEKKCYYTQMMLNSRTPEVPLRMQPIIQR